LLIPL
jgi:hypothetical protein